MAKGQKPSASNHKQNMYCFLCDWPANTWNRSIFLSSLRQFATKLTLSLNPVSLFVRLSSEANHIASELPFYGFGTDDQRLLASACKVENALQTDVLLSPATSTNSIRTVTGGDG